MIFPIPVPAAIVAPAPPPPPGVVQAYRNPILRDVADPFVLQWKGVYYLYRTANGRGELDVQTSRDLVHWTPGPIVWKPGSGDAARSRLVWAPEVFYENGVFRLYFSAAGPDGAPRIWSATATSPLGPFQTDPTPLSKPWSIDVSTFTDDDGTRYLFRSQQLADADGKLTGRARVEGKKADAGDDAWTPLVGPDNGWLEAPTVFKTAPDRYTLLYSGGGAHLPSYFVGYATASRPLGPWTKRGIVVPHTASVPGPGHQCLVLGPDNVTPYLLYHRKRIAAEGWERDGMLDRLAILPDGTLESRAPSTNPQPVPPGPAFTLARRTDLTSTGGGTWQVSGDVVRQSEPRGKASSRVTAYSIPANAVVALTIERTAGTGKVGVSLVEPKGSGRIGFSAPLEHAQPILLTRRGSSIEFRSNGRTFFQSPRVSPVSATGPLLLELSTEDAAATFSAVAVTPYATPRPLPAADPNPPGWRKTETGHIEQRGLGPGIAAYPVPTVPTNPITVRVQGWALGISSPYPKYGIRLRSGNDRIEAFIDPITNVLATHGVVGGKEIAWQNSPLPLGFEFTDEHAITARWSGDRFTFTVDNLATTAQTRTIKLATAPRLELVTEDARAAYRLPK